MENETVIQQLEQSNAQLFKWAGAVQDITTDEEQKNAEDLLIAARFALKQADEKRKELTRPIDEAKAGIIGLFKPYIAKLEQGIIAPINAALQRYHTKKSVEAEAARLTALAEEAARIAYARGNGEILEVLPKPTEQPVPKTSHANLGTVSYREDYEIQIVAPNMVPRDLCIPDMAKIRLRVKSGILNIPGVIVSKKCATTARASQERRT